MQLNLSTEEREVLADVLSTYLSNLRYEIADTDDYDYRTGLKEKETILTRIVAALEDTAKS
jgi:hypothetical protein